MPRPVTARLADPIAAPEGVTRTLDFYVRPTPVPVPAPKKDKKKKTPTGFYRRQGSLIWYFRRRIDGVLINESTTFTDLEDAKRWADERVTALRYGHRGWSVKGIPTVREFFNARGDETPYDRLMLPFVDAFADTKINQVTDDMCRQWMKDRQKVISQYGTPMSKGTVRTECSHLRALFNGAVGQRKYLRENPWSMAAKECKVKLPKKSIRRRKLELSEQPEFLASCATKAPALRRLAEVIIGSGLRRREIAYLTPADVHHGRIYVPETTAKGGKPRSVPVDPEVLALLETQRVAAGLGERSPNPYFPWHHVYLDELFQKACDRAQIVPNITPHDLRRTYGSRMAYRVPPKVLQLLMGHADLSTTMDHYVDADEDKLADVVAAAGSPLAGDGVPKRGA